MGVSLAVVNGNPAIASACGNNHLEYVRATTSTGDSLSDWGDIVAIDSDVGSLRSSLAVVAGNPAIAYCGWTGPESYALMYVRSTTGTGNSQSDWSQRVMVDDSAQYVGGYVSLVFVYDSPAIAYEDNSAYLLKYAQAGSSTGANPADWNRLEELDNCNGVMAPSMAIVNGNPAISYVSGRDLMYAYYVP